PEQLAGKIKDKKSKFAIVFGREGPGLTNEEIMMADFVVTITSNTKYPTLNLSHAVNIILYELFKATASEHVSSHITPISAAEKEQLTKMLNKVLNKMTFSTKEKKQTQKTVWKRMIGKSMMTKREAYALMGFLGKLL
ncbi:TrmH family RNA methyltransferase, partial [Nanoarchaeota archaeon]